MFNIPTHPTGELSPLRFPCLRFSCASRDSVRECGNTQPVEVQCGGTAPGQRCLPVTA